MDGTLIGGLFLVSVSTSLAIIDARIYRLPNIGTLSLALGGLVASFCLSKPYIVDAVAGGVLAATLLWLVRWIYEFRMQREGVGLGDVKLGAACGIWLGWEDIGLFFLFAALLALSGVWLKRPENGLIPFGPYLAVSAVLIWMNDHIAASPFHGLFDGLF